MIWNPQSVVLLGNVSKFFILKRKKGVLRYFQICFHSRHHWRGLCCVNSDSIHIPGLLTRMGWTQHGRRKILPPQQWRPSSPQFWLWLDPPSSRSWRSSPGQGSACSRTPPVVLSAALQPARRQLHTQQESRQAVIKSELFPASAFFVYYTFSSWITVQSLTLTFHLWNRWCDRIQLGSLPSHELQTRNYGKANKTSVTIMPFRDHMKLIFVSWKPTLTIANLNQMYTINN